MFYSGGLRSWLRNRLAKVQERENFWDLNGLCPAVELGSGDGRLRRALQQRIERRWGELPLQMRLYDLDGRLGYDAPPSTKLRPQIYRPRNCDILLDVRASYSDDYFLSKAQNDLIWLPSIRDAFHEIIRDRGGPPVVAEMLVMRFEHSPSMGS